MQSHALLASLLFISVVGPKVMLRAEEALLTRTIDVRSLSVAQAGQEKDARLTGVIIYVEKSGILLQDETGSTFFRPTEQQLSLQVGDEVEVRGKTRMGRYFAGLGAVEVRLLRRGQPAPAIPVGYDDIAAAHYFYQRVAVEGIIRSIEPTADWSVMRLAMGARVLEVRVAQVPPSGRDFIDAKVRLVGISAGSTNERRQVVETFVRMRSWDDIEILDPPASADLVPRVSPGDLFTFRPSGRPDRRIRVSGTITAIFPQGEIYLQEGEIAFAARLNRSAELSVGDRVEVVGFAGTIKFAASLVDAEIEHRAPGEPPSPIAVRSADSLSSAHDARLLSVDAIVADGFKSLGGYTLILSGRNRTIQTYVTGGQSPPATGSRVRVAGICHVEIAPSINFVRQAGAMQLHARSSADVVVLESPRWWTTAKLAVALGVLAGVILLAGAWNVALHRQVRRKTEALRERIESEAALEERHRIAQEFHDTLQQDLTGLGLRLDAAATRAFDENGRQIMGASRKLLARIQAETKNIVSNLRQPGPFDLDLVATLKTMIENCTAKGGAEVRLHVAAQPAPLARSTLNHVHMMARESVNNALQHASATQIGLEVKVESGKLVLRISDDGRGLDVDSQTRGKSGHFGCIGMRERARKIGAAVEWHSAPGRGTTVEIVLPLNTPGRSRSPGSEATPATT